VSQATLQGRELQEAERRRKHEILKRRIARPASKRGTAISITPPKRRVRGKAKRDLAKERVTEKEWPRPSRRAAFRIVVAQGCAITRGPRRKRESSSEHPARNDNETLDHLLFLIVAAPI
jgi:hypothetical protein